MADDDPKPTSEKEAVEELGRRLQELRNLHLRSRPRWDRPATVIGIVSALAGAAWTLLSSLEPVGLVLTAVGLGTLAYDQLYKVPRDETRALERRRQVDLVINTAGKLRELVRRGEQK